MVWYGQVGSCPVWCGQVGLSLVWYGRVESCMVWFGIAEQQGARHQITSTVSPLLHTDCMRATITPWSSKSSVSAGSPHTAAVVMFIQKEKKKVMT